MRLTVDCEALVVGMTLVPGLISRNKSFSLFENPEVRRARGRSALLRGIVRQLAGAQGHVEGLEIVSGAAGRELRYRLPRAHVERRALLSDLEYSCVSYLAGRANLQGLEPTDDDRARIDAALRRLSAGLRLSAIESPSRA
ncbi:MAG TPA: hypothetical protein VEK07_01150 [Polyangiaceae bacterium]|nr:hypothetical protein [Polyangiaceae bacterium]